MTTEFTYGIAQNDTPYVEAAPGAFQVGDEVTTEFRFAAHQPKRARRGAAAPHPAGTTVLKLKVTGSGKAFDAQTDLGSSEQIMRQRFYCEVIEEQRIFDEE